jgi:hypothetical protein
MGGGAPYTQLIPVKLGMFVIVTDMINLVNFYVYLAVEEFSLCEGLIIALSHIGNHCGPYNITLRCRADM